MSVLFCHDHRFIVAPDGAVYSRGQYSESIVSRYERGFGTMFIAGRTMPAPDPFDPSRLNRVFDDASRFLPVADLSSAGALLVGDAAARRQLAQAMAEMDAVVVRLPSEVGLLAGAVARRQGKPLLTEVVACVHDGLASHGGPKARAYAPLARRRVRRAVARSDWTLYVTEHFLQRRYPSRGEQASVSNVQLPQRDEDLAARRLERIHEGPLLLGMVAAMFHNEKRVDVAIRALAAAVRSGADLRLEVAGPGETAELEALAAALGVADRVCFLGALPHGEPLFSFLDGADVYVQTSFQEGLPRGLVEAMSRALPALGSDAGGTDELLADDWRHAPGDADTLARQMLRLRDPALRTELAKENFAKAAEFTADKLDTRRAAFWRKFSNAHENAFPQELAAGGMSEHPTVLRRMRPEVGVGGFSHHDSTIEFYTTVNALVNPEATVLDVGAGRGAFLNDTSEYRRNLRLFKGRVKEIIGVDTDPVVATNAALDRHHVISVGDPLPIADASVDIVISDWTFEHVATPDLFAKELKRVLKPGGWICARTPNKWGLTGLGSRLVPNQIHSLLLKRISPRRQEKDVFPVTYKLNTQRAIRQYFPPSDFRDCSYLENGDPSYYGDSDALWKATEVFFRLTPRRFAAKHFIFLQKAAGTP